MELLDRGAADLPEIGVLFSGTPPTLENVRERFDLLVRMLFSCLVDADRLDTAGGDVSASPCGLKSGFKLCSAHSISRCANSRWPGQRIAAGG